MKKTLITVLLATAMYGYAQPPQPMATPTYPQAGVPVERDFSQDLELPLVNAPMPTKNPKAAVTPQEIYSPNTNGGSYSAQELQGVSDGQVFTNVVNGGASGGAGVSARGASTSVVAVPSGGSITMLPRKKRVVLADELLQEEDEEDGRRAQRAPIIIPPTEVYEGPVGDGVWVLVMLAVGYVAVRRKRGVIDN